MADENLPKTVLTCWSTRGAQADRKL